MTEGFISAEQIAQAGIALGFSDTFDVHKITFIVGKMTGLDMAQYILIEDLDAFGWHLARKKAEAVSEQIYCPSCKAPIDPHTCPEQTENPNTERREDYHPAYCQVCPVCGRHGEHW